jgi:CDP-diacylglycerol pyrophosphatase
MNICLPAYRSIGVAFPCAEVNIANSLDRGFAVLQLHILVSCIAPVVADFLRRHQAEIHGAWSPLRAKLDGHKFLAMKVETESLAYMDSFKLLVRGLPSGRISLRTQTLDVFGATFRNGKSGFYLLANDPGASPRDTVSAEALLDDKCTN